jgi:hypothetical protein
MDALAKGRAALRLQLLALADAPLSPGKLAKRQRNQDMLRISVRLSASYNV